MPPLCGKRRAEREAKLIDEGASASDAAAKADKDMSAKEDSELEELAARLMEEK